MNSGFPSMTALLGLLAVAGYQNRTRSPKCSAASEKARRRTADKAAARRRIAGKAAWVACSAS